MFMNLNFYLQEVLHQENCGDTDHVACWSEYFDCCFNDDFEEKVLVLAGNPSEVLC